MTSIVPVLPWAIEVLPIEITKSPREGADQPASAIIRQPITSPGRMGSHSVVGEVVSEKATLTFLREPGALNSRHPIMNGKSRSAVVIAIARKRSSSRGQNEMSGLIEREE